MVSLGLSIGWRDSFPPSGGQSSASPQNLALHPPPDRRDCGAMPALTRRLADDPHRVFWLVYLDDVHVGTISQRAGVPKHADQWSWRIAFYPVCNRCIREEGTAPRFDWA